MGRRGPKPRTGIVKEPNGRASRKPVDVMTRLNSHLEAEEREALRVGIEGRHRLYGINPERLRDTAAGSFVGRLYLAGHITAQQLEAATRYDELYHDMQVAISGPQSPGAVNLNATHGMPGRENEQRSVKAIAEWRAAQDAIQRRQNQIKGTGALYAALDYCVIRDAECPHMIEWLREALDTLARHFKIGDIHKQRAA